MKFAICQELYENTDWPDQCRLIAEAGYTGIEVAPFALGPNVSDVPASRLRQYRETAAAHGLEIIGLHWLLARTSGLHLTHPDPAVRTATADYLRRLARVNQQLGGTVMVFGSPPQRSLLAGVTREQAVDYASDVFAAIAPDLHDAGSILCLEPLTQRETDFLNTCQDAMEVIERVNHPAIQLHQDVKAMLGAERDSIPELIHRHKNFCRHFHVNDSNLLGPGMGETDFHPILRALQETNYSGWVSVEVFDYSPGAQHIAVESLRYLNAVLRDLQSESGNR